MWVVLAAFYCTCTIDGCHYSAGVFEDPIAEELQLSHSHIVITNFLEVGASNFVALLAPLLIEKLGLKRTACLGAGVATLGWLVISVSMPISVGFEMLIAGKFRIGAGIGTLYLPVLIVVAKACFSDWSQAALACGKPSSLFWGSCSSSWGGRWPWWQWQLSVFSASSSAAACPKTAVGEGKHLSWKKPALIRRPFKGKICLKSPARLAPIMLQLFREEGAISSNRSRK